MLSGVADRVSYLLRICCSRARCSSSSGAWRSPACWSRRCSGSPRATTRARSRPRPASGAGARHSSTPWPRSRWPTPRSCRPTGARRRDRALPPRGPQGVRGRARGHAPARGVLPLVELARDDRRAARRRARGRAALPRAADARRAMARLPRLPHPALQPGPRPQPAREPLHSAWAGAERIIELLDEAPTGRRRRRAPRSAGGARGGRLRGRRVQLPGAPSARRWAASPSRSSRAPRWRSSGPAAPASRPSRSCCCASTTRPRAPCGSTATTCATCAWPTCGATSRCCCRRR